MKRGSWKPWFKRGGAAGGSSNYRNKPFMARNLNKDNDNDGADDILNPESEYDSAFSTKAEEGCPYKAFHLYFPNKSEPTNK
jgi:hypothetical protein